MCLDNKKLLILDTDMATNPCMYSGTQKKQHKKNDAYLDLKKNLLTAYVFFKLITICNWKVTVYKMKANFIHFLICPKH